MDFKISVVVPIYNVQKYLSKCIVSILKQTYTNIEVILINDGSTDNSLKICEYYKLLDSRIKLINSKNKGVSSARNLGVKYSSGDFVGFVDSDDFIEINMYETMINCIIANQADICVLSKYTIKNSNIIKLCSIDSYTALKKLFLLQFPTSLWAYLYNAKILKEVVLDENIYFFEDFKFNYSILRNCKCISLCNYYLYNYKINDYSINNQEINDKKITCLEISDSITEDLKENNIRELVKFIPFFTSHFIVSMVLCILRSNSIDKKYCKIISQHSRKNLFIIIFCKYVPLNYKLITYITCFNNVILWRLMKFTYHKFKKKKLINY